MTSHIYIITDGRNTKIGITTALDKRIASYKTHNPNFRVFRTFETDQKTAKRVERVIIGAFKDDAVGEGKEWFAVGPELVERHVTVLLSRDGGREMLPSMHEIPLTQEGRFLQESVRNAIEAAGKEPAIDNRRRLWQLQQEWRDRFGDDSARAETPATRKFKAEIDALEMQVSPLAQLRQAGKDRLRELFADRAGLGFPVHKVPEGTIQLGGLGVDWGYCDPDSKIVRDAVRGTFRLPLDDHTEGFFHLSRLASGHFAALGTARISMPYRPRLDDRDAWEEISSAAKSMGWLCSMHDEWSWHSPYQTGLILYQPTTPVRTLLNQWEESFRRWAVERQKPLLVDARGDEDFKKVLADLAYDNTFPLAIRSWDELLETYFDRYWGFEMPDRFKQVYRELVERWLSRR